MGDIRANKICVDIVTLHQTNIMQISWCTFVPEGRVFKAYMLRSWFRQGRYTDVAY